MADPRLARHGYTADEVDYWLRQPGLQHRTRFDLLDPSPSSVGDAFVTLTGNAPPKVGELETVLADKGAAVVDFSTGQKLSGGLKLKMRPDERLRDAALQWLIKPYYLLRIPNGDVLEFPQGTYVWDVAERDVDPALEMWSVSLADLTFFLDTESPDFGGFSLPEGTRDTDGIKQVLTTAGIFDHSGVVDSDHTIVGDATWGTTRVEFTSGGFGTFFYIHGNPEEGERGGFRTTTLHDIAGDLHQGIAYLPPHVNRDGTYQARPAPDIRTVGPVTTFGTAPDSITFRNITTQADKSKIANLVFVYTENPQGSTFIGIASADVSYPGHPWSEAKCGHVLTRTIPSPNATTPDDANAIAQVELAKALTFAQTVEWQTMAHPTLEPYDVVAVYVKGDPEFDTPRNFQLRSVSFDLITGIMRCTGRRIYEPVDTGLIVDTGLEDERTRRN